MSPADAQRLQEVFRREYRSLLQYVRQASPYAAGPDRKLLEGVMRIAAEECSALDSFEQFLGSSRVPLPRMGSFPVAFTDLNFVAIRSLLPRLAAEQKQDLVKLEADAAGLGEAPAGEALRQLAELHRRHLGELESLR